MLSRRHFLQTSAVALASSLAVPALARSAPGPAAASIATAADFAALEKASGGRLGAGWLTTGAVARGTVAATGWDNPRLPARPSRKPLIPLKPAFRSRP